MKKHACILLILLILSLALRYNFAHAQPSHYDITISPEHPYYLRGETAQFHVFGNASMSYVLTIYNPYGEIVYQQDRQTDSDGKDTIILPIPPAFLSGTYTIKAAVAGITSETWVSIVETTGFQPQVFPFERQHKNINYTITARGFQAVSSSGNISIKYPSLPISFSVSAYANNMTFVERLKNTQLGIYIDLSYLFIHNGMKLVINGSIPQPTSYTFDFESPRQLVKRLDALRDGFLVFDWSDMRKVAQAFSYNPETKQLTVNIPQTFNIDPYIFEDGFESGNFSEWTSTTGSPTVQNVTKHCGTWAMRSTGAADVYATKTITPIPTAFMRSYVYYHAWEGSNDWLLKLRRAVPSSTIIQGWAGIKNDGGTRKWQVLWDNGGGSTVADTPLPSLDTWYCLEMKISVGPGAGDGEARLYVNGTEIITETGLTFGDNGSIGNVDVGICGDAGSDAYVDCVVIDDEYIGVESAADSTAPTYSDVDHSTVTVDTSCTFSCKWNDETNLTTTGGYIFSTNNTATWINETWAAFTSTPQWANVSKTLNTTVGQVVGYRWYANDTSNNWNNTGTLNFLITEAAADSTAPTYGSIAASTTNSGVSSTFSVQWNDETDLTTTGGYIFGTNNTGTWNNETWIVFTATPQWANVSKTLNTTVGLVVGYKWWANDTAGNWNSTMAIQTLTVTGYTLTLQARDKDGTNLPRAVSFSVTFPNSTVTAFTSNTAGLKAITTMYGTHSITVTWQTHIVKTATSVAVIADQTQNFDTLISRLSSGSNYVLVSVDSTTTGTPILKPFNSWRIESIQGSGGKQVKVDVANWLEAREPLYFKIRGASYEKDSQDWSFTSNIFTWANLVFSLEEYADIEMIWTDPNPPSGSSTTTEPALTTVPTTTVTPPPIQIDPMLIVVVGVVALVGAAVYTVSQPKSNPWKTKPKKTRWPKTKQKKGKWPKGKKK